MRYPMKSIIRLGQQHIPPEPCEFCKYKARCRAEKLACYKFVKFCRIDGPRWLKTFKYDEKPNRSIYSLIFPGDVDAIWPFTRRH